MLQEIIKVEKTLVSSSFFYSLNPLKLRPTSFHKLAQMSTEALSKEESKIFLKAFLKLILSQKENFPENIFWDLDYLAYTLSQKKSEKEMMIFADRISSLNKSYGSKSPLKFAYIHDFVYGFDWHRWVLRDFEARKSSRPYSHSFLSYLENRALELEDLISKNDTKYPPLREDEKRNPFSFPRDPKEEISLHLKLAEKGEIPFEAWSFNEIEEVSQNKNFHKDREVTWESQKTGSSK